MWGILDVGVDVDGQNVDAELLFIKGPDIGFTFDVAVGECRYCVLLENAAEQWLNDADMSSGGEKPSFRFGGRDGSSANC